MTWNMSQFAVSLKLLSLGIILYSEISQIFIRFSLIGNKMFNISTCLEFKWLFPVKSLIKPHYSCAKNSFRSTKQTSHFTLYSLKNSGLQLVSQQPAQPSVGAIWRLVHVSLHTGFDMQKV